MRTIEQMVQQEFLCCMSSIVSTLAPLGCGGFQAKGSDQQAAQELADQALELCSPIPDYEEAAIQAGWSQAKVDPQYFHIGRAGEPMQTVRADSWQALCEEYDIEPYDREVYEHWAITDWFADKLMEAGEKVDKDFGNLCIWARTTTGQGIASDSVVERIYAAMMAPEPVEG